MELRNLRHAVVLARKLNFTRAAEELGLSQSALSRSIQSLEQAAGIRLFDRDRGMVSLTRQGTTFIHRAEVLVAEAEDLRTSAQRAASAELGDVAFGIEALPARAMLSDVLAEAIGRSPGMRNRVEIRCIEALWSRLVSGEIEFFVSAEGHIPVAPAVRISRLGTFPLSFLVRPGHPALGSLYPPEPYPVLIAGSAGDLGFVPACLKSITTGPQHIVENYEVLVKMTERTNGVLLASRYAALDELEQGRLCELPIPDDEHTSSIPIVLHSLARRSLSPGAIVLQKAFQRQMRLLTLAHEKP